jgi:hypothetical protein
VSCDAPGRRGLGGGGGAGPLHRPGGAVVIIEALVYGILLGFVIAVMG